MRIAILGSAYPFRGGLAAYNELMAQKLLTLGHEVRIFTFTVQYPKWLFPGKTQYRSEPPPEDFPYSVLYTLLGLFPGGKLDDGWLRLRQSWS